MGESSIAEGGGWGLIAVLEQAWNIVCFSVVNNPPDSSLPVYHWQSFLMPNLIMEHVDRSAGDLIHLLLGLLKYNPLDRLTAPESLKHPFFTRDNYQWY